jgi:tetratricopeptide (TPR) repeat protein
MKIFVGSTVKDLGDLRDELYRSLKELGHTPWFSEKDDFPTNRHQDSMTNCIRVAEECDLFVVLLDKRAGLPYTRREGSPYPELFDSTISEAEYRCARKKGKPVCIFIRKRAENESAVYRQIKNKKQRESMKWYSEPAVYEFYDRLMHEKPHIPWRRTFDSIREITGSLNTIIGEVQAKSSVSYGIPIPPQPYFAHPYPLQKNFTGRVAERNMLTEWLTKGRHPMLALNAIGGMGKTALSWYWVQEDVIKGGLSPHGIIWWSFYDKESSFENFLKHAISYVAGGRIDPDGLQSTKEKMSALQGVLYNNEYLLVLDGVERVLRAYYNLGSPYQGDEVKIDERGEYRSFIDPNLGDFIRMLASGYPQTKTLLTSRLFPKELDDLEGCVKTDLTQLDKEDAVEFFKRQGVKGTRAEIEEVCRAYGFHPLSLRLLSGMIVHDMKYGGDIKAWKKHNPLTELKGTKKEHHILELAYNSLDKKKQAFISRLSAFRTPMDYDAVSIFNDFCSEDEFNEVLLELVDRGMLFRGEKSNKFDLHPIVRRYCYDRLKNKESIHLVLTDYFAYMPAPERIESLDDLAPVIELYHHTVRVGRYDDAAMLFRDSLGKQLYFKFGAYQTIIELLCALFPDGEDKLPRLKVESAQAWMLNSLANSYSLSGRSRRAVPLFEMSNEINEKTENKENLAKGLNNLALDQIQIGELDAAESNFRRMIEISREIGEEFLEAIGYNELGQILAYRGEFNKSENELNVAQKVFDDFVKKEGSTNLISVVSAYKSIRSLLVNNTEEALKSANNARELAGVEKVERDIITAEWLCGAAYLMKRNFVEAENHLAEALTRDRKINLVELEPDILLEFAKLRFKQNHKEETLKFAEEALQIADRCEYRLKQADMHNFLAEFYLDAGELEQARKHGEMAKERAECGYKPALEKAEKLLEDIERM